ncbi:MAG: hypothetical protein H9W81_02500 [Enterococcus sp.]|nr:hypothetical protein [Enterococcus sp.]
MISHSDKFAYKDFFYALDLNSLKSRDMRDDRFITASMQAIWFKRDKGNDTVCLGTVNDLLPSGLELTVDNFMDEFKSGRYGGKTKFKWDGVRMWSADNVYDDLVKAHDYLDPILEQFIENRSTPNGYSGWYSIKD